jgi:hypothetical protein
MSINETSDGKWPVQWSMPSEYTLLAAAAVGFLVLHILVSVMLMPASARAPMTPEQEVLSRSATEVGVAFV